MRKPRHISLKPTDRYCPHCDGPIVARYGRWAKSSRLACRKCHCHWSIYGELIRWGARCPVLVRT